MKAVVLSGGEGSRLRPITHTNAKQLIPIANKPILFSALESIRDAGITEVGVVVGSTAAEVENAVGYGDAWGLTVTYIHQSAPLGLAHAALVARKFVGRDPFVLYLGDNLLLEGITRFVREFERHRPNAQIFLAQVPEPERFGVAVLDGERVTNLVEKPSERISDLALVGVYLFDETLFEAAEAIKPSGRGELEITDAIQYLIDSGRTVRAERVTGWWKDTGRPEDLLEANRMMLTNQEPRISGEVDGASELSGSVVIEEGGKVVRSHLEGPVIVGRGSVVEGSTVGPCTSIHNNCRVGGSVVENSIVLEGCRIEGISRLADSILGRHVEVRPSGSAEPVHRLIVGDQSQLELS
ncbi:MAG: glucose-1-phosphate thymidylyltransferase [Actinomycetota bacterium]|nr:glucose-1-phosphate thymidylyltransferase [Actinomycetota bacterium]